VRARERESIRAALERSGGNQTKAAHLLGISRRTLASRLAKYGLPRPLKG
jgi:DNA-binding NtrC family response regulator